MSGAPEQPRGAAAAAQGATLKSYRQRFRTYTKIPAAGRPRSSVENDLCPRRPPNR